MRRLAFATLAVAAFAPFAAAPGGAAVPCRDRIYNDWYHDGKIATSYPIACYRDAFKKVPTDAREYSSLADDIRSAMQAALAKEHGRKTVPTQVGTGGAAKSPRSESSSKTPKPRVKPRAPKSAPHDPSPEQVNTTLPTTVAASATTGRGSGVPVPLLVLGGLALLLTAVGAAGLIAKRRRL
jgi:hypothetical protein